MSIQSPDSSMFVNFESSQQLNSVFNQIQQPKRCNPGILTIASSNSKLFEPRPLSYLENISQNYQKPDHDYHRPMQYQFPVYDPNNIQIMRFPSPSSMFVNLDSPGQSKSNYPQCKPILPYNFNRPMEYQPNVYDPNNFQIRFPSPSHIFLDSHCPQASNMYLQQNYPEYGEPYQGDGL